MEGGDADADKTAYEYLLTPKFMYSQLAVKPKANLASWFPKSMRL